jgi:outer membrane receptor protein involved in Fe transport
MKKLYVLLIICIFPFLHTVAQTSSSAISGIVKSKAGDPLKAVTVFLQEQKHLLTHTDAQGRFTLPMKPGLGTIRFKSVGFKIKAVRIDFSPGISKDIEVLLEEDVSLLHEVSVSEKSALVKTRQSAYQITAIDATKLHNTTLNIAQGLSVVPGIRVREAGGLGSSVDFSLNGFSGNQVKFFIDGVPMDNFGSSFGINNIPINLAQRIEVYKGVVPVTLGSDALGGAVNIVTGDKHSNYLDASYSIGSFNTHKTAVNLGLNAKTGLTFQLNAYQNYSDNNYWIEAETPIDGYGTVKKVRARRFHDAYHNEMLIASIGVRDKSWADQFRIGIDLGSNRNDLQNGATMEDVYGARKSKGTIILPSIKYFKKDLLLKGLNLTVSGNYNLGHETTIDTVFKQYNWLGEVVKDFTYGNPDRKGGERNRMNYRYKNNNGIFSANLSYQISEKHAVVINENFTTFKREGTDLLRESDAFFQRPNTMRKNVLGMSYRFDGSERWNITLFGKHYSQFTNSFVNKSGVDQPSHSDYAWAENSFNTLGYGFATTYFVKPQLQLRASYEHGIRVPTADELFGNMNALDGNISLKPEKSENFNLGFIYSPVLGNTHFLTIDGGILYRYSTDFIRASLNKGKSFTIQKMVNLRDVDNKGLELSFNYRYKRQFNLSANVSYQNLRNQTQYEGGAGDIESIVYKDRLPNMPYLFGNTDASYTFHGLLARNSNLTIGYQLQYVHQYFEGWPSLGDKSTKNTIPTQFAHNANLLYSFAHGKYNVALECLNLTDALLYDHFKLQKPSRSFNLKFRYFLFRMN